ncbi:MAG: hypothetical protein IT426_20750 [Pirellulales bacterium]|nr:hypothetical protein [Pirellulales bacterium]
MIRSSLWNRVSRRRPCPICGKADWCLCAGPDNSPTAVICARTESPRKCGESGWLHILRRDDPTWSPRIRKIEIDSRRIGAQTTDFGKLADQFRQAVKPQALEKLASALGLSVESLQRLGAGWSAKHGAWTFPMRDAGGKVLGIRLRLPDGRKFSVKGGHEGLFLPDGIDAHDSLLIAEGPTDTAALLDLGFAAVGRSCCTGGVKLLIDLVRRLNPSGMVIVADADAPGQRGAESLAAILVAYSASVKVIAPPPGAKDAREWKRRGATHTNVQAAIDAAEVRKLAIRVQAKPRKAGKHHG